MASMVDVVRFCRLRMRSIQLHLFAHYRPVCHHINRMVPTTPWVISHLQWWAVVSNLTAGCACIQPRPSVVVTNDRRFAVRLGSHAPTTADSGNLGAPSLLLSHQCARVTSGCRSAQAFFAPGINRQGGTHSSQLCAQTWELLHWCIRHGIVLSAIHLPGNRNDLADALSCGRVVPTQLQTTTFL